MIIIINIKYIILNKCDFYFNVRQVRQNIFMKNKDLGGFQKNKLSLFFTLKATVGQENLCLD